MRVTRARVVGATALATTAAAAGIVVGVSGGGDGRAASPPERHAGATARVERRDLIDTETVDGTLGYADKRPAANRLSGTYTWLPHAGQVIRPGQTLWVIDAQPVILMDGSVPAYRDLRSGERGADVRQLERNLAALGYDPGTVDGRFDASTAAAVMRWQHDHGLARTGVVEAGRVVFLPGARRVGTLSASVGDSAGNPSSNNNNGNNRNIAYHPSEATPSGTTPSSSTTPSSTTPSSTTPSSTTPSSSTPSHPRSRSGSEDKNKNGSNKNNGNRNGNGNGNGNRNNANPSNSNNNGNNNNNANSPGQATKVMDTTSTRRVVTIDLDAAKQQVAHVGERAPVQLPDGSTVPGRVASVGRVAQQSSADQNQGGGASATIRVTVRLTGHRGVGRLDAAPVSVELTRSRERHVLAVPVTALVASGNGAYAVEAVTPTGGTRLVPVTPGLFAGGYVAVQGAGVHEGMTITVPSGA